MTTPVQTYHCLCTNLIFATTYPLTNHRKLDHSIILPSPRLSSRQEAALAGNEADDVAEDDHAPVSDFITQLVGICAPDSQLPLLIRSDEGIEKRHLLRCGRCKSTLGYQLDWEQYNTQRGGVDSFRSGRRDDVLYLLEDAVETTAGMKAR